MIITYEILERKNPSMGEGQSNTYIAYPLQVTRCCNDSMIWFFANVLDIVIKEQVFIKKDKDNKFVDKYSHCQFCGSKHRCYTMEEVDELQRKESEAEELKIVEKEMNTT